MTRWDECAARFQGKRVLVVGLARSGVAAARTLMGLGAQVWLNDRKDAAALGGMLEGLTGWHDRLGMPLEQALDDMEMLVISPAVPWDCVGLLEARKRSIAVIGELELGAQLCEAPITAITGTNGKTTTTALVGDIYKAAGVPTVVAGNIGLAFSGIAAGLTKQHRAVVEVSSFQLESVQTLRPDVSAILNITPDHLNRHGTLENYAMTKGRIFENQTAGRLVLNAADQWSARYAAQAQCDLAWFDTRYPVREGAFVRDGVIIRAHNGHEEIICDCKALLVPGQHNLENALAAVAMTAELDKEAVSAALLGFKGVEHRMELVAEIRGVRWINDSKATNPDSAIKALEAMDRPVVLIAGGQSKGGSYESFVEAFQERVQSLIVLGETAGEIAHTARNLGFTGSIAQADDMPGAVKAAAKQAQPGMAVLLSPACASWDMFLDFEERGRIFKNAVLDIAR